MTGGKLLELEGRIMGLEALVANLWVFELRRRSVPTEGVGLIFEHMAAPLETAPAAGSDEQALTALRFQAAETVRRVGDLAEYFLKETPG